MRAGVTNRMVTAQSARPFRSLLTTLISTISHTREQPCLTNEYSVVVSRDDSTITLSQSKAKHVP